MYPIITEHRTHTQTKTHYYDERERVALQAAWFIGKHAVWPARTRTERTIRIHAALLRSRLATLINRIKTAMTDLSKATASTKTVPSAASRKLMIIKKR